MSKEIDCHLYAAIVACSAVQDIIDVLPETDLVMQLEQLMETQNELFVCLLQDKHYGTNKINDFLLYARNLKTQIYRLKEGIGGYEC